jgi:hypothetical protein
MLPDRSCKAVQDRLLGITLFSAIVPVEAKAVVYEANVTVTAGKLNE